MRGGLVWVGCELEPLTAVVGSEGFQMIWPAANGPAYATLVVADQIEPSVVGQGKCRSGEIDAAELGQAALVLQVIAVVACDGTQLRVRLIGHIGSQPIMEVTLY